MRLLHQRNAPLNIFAFKVLALVTVGWVGPDSLDHPQRLPGHFSFFIPRDAIGGEGERPNAGAEPALQAPEGQVIEQGYFFGDPDGVPQWQDVNERAQTNSLCPLRRGAEKCPGTWTLGKAEVKVMFCDKVEIHSR